MKRSEAARVLRWLAPVCAVLLAGLRAIMLKSAFDEGGLLPPTSGALQWAVLASAVLFCGLWLLCTRLNGLPGTERCFSNRTGWVIARIAAGLLVLLGAMLVLFDGQSALHPTEYLAAWGGIAAGLLMLWMAWIPKSKHWVFWVRLLPALYVGAALVLRFRSWSHDPLIIHILPLLFSWTCCMVEMMLLSGFSLNAGHRRSAVLFGLGTGVFTCMALPDFLLGQTADLSELLTMLGFALWCVAAAYALLCSRNQNAEAPSNSEDA